MTNLRPRIVYFAAVFLACACVHQAHAQNYPIPRFFYAMSPKHPSTWVDGATRTHKELRWDSDKQLLVANVTYSTADYADNTHPTEDEEFTLPFPSVHFDAASGKFTAGGTTVALLRHGFFGDHVTLAHDVQLSVHRHHGVIYGALIPGSSEDN